MTVLRMAARRMGLVEMEAPQAVEARLLRWLRVRPPRHVAQHQALAALMHLGYGMTWGAVWGALWGKRRPGIPSGVLYGVAQTVAGFAGYLPALGVTPPPREVPLRAHAVSLVAHAAYGAVLTFVSQEFARQEAQQARTFGQAWVRRTPHVA